MVSLNYRIQCSCGAWRSKFVQSGQSDKWNISFECSHWNCDIWQSTRTGWFFGANAKIDLDFRPKCLKCKKSWTYQCGNWGWNNGDSSGQIFNCCGHQLLIRRQQCNSWTDFVFSGLTNEIYWNGFPVITGTKLVWNSIPGTLTWT